jgi:hypothetical protein
MRVPATMLGLVAATGLILSPAITSAHGAAPSKPVKVSKPAHVGKPITTTVKSVSAKPVGAKPVKTTTPGKPTTLATTPIKSTAGKPVTTSVKPAKTTTPKATTSHANAKTTRTTTTLSPVTTATLNPIAAKIASKPNLNAKITRLLPIDPLTGTTMTLNRASLGFKNQGQFIAALHVSQNLGIPFSELKSHMVTVTPGLPGQPDIALQTGSLGQAIQASKSTANFTTEVERAELQASADLRVLSPSTSTTVTTSTVQTTKKNPTMPRGVR